MDAHSSPWAVSSWIQNGEQNLHDPYTLYKERTTEGEEEETEGQKEQEENGHRQILINGEVGQEQYA